MESEIVFGIVPRWTHNRMFTCLSCALLFSFCFGAVKLSQTNSTENILEGEIPLKPQKALGAPTCDLEPGNGPVEWCRHGGLDEEDGEWKLLTIGNTWTTNYGRIFYDECGPVAKGILRGTYRNSSGLSVQEYLNRVAREKPDYGFLFSRHLDTSKKDVEMFMKSIKKKLFILNVIPGNRAQENLIADCQRCEQIDIVADRLIGIPGLEYLRPVFRKICRSL